MNEFELILEECVDLIADGAASLEECLDELSEPFGNSLHQTRSA